MKEVIQERIQAIDLERRHIGVLIQFQTENVNVVGTLERVDHHQDAYLEHGDGGWWDLKPKTLTMTTTLTISGWVGKVNPLALVTIQTGYRELEAPPEPEQLALDILVGEVIEEGNEQ